MSIGEARQGGIFTAKSTAEGSRSWPFPCPNPGNGTASQGAAIRMTKPQTGSKGVPGSAPQPWRGWGGGGGGGGGSWGHGMHVDNRLPLEKQPPLSSSFPNTAGFLSRALGAKKFHLPAHHAFTSWLEQTLSRGRVLGGKASAQASSHSPSAPTQPQQETGRELRWRMMRPKQGSTAVAKIIPGPHRLARWKFSPPSFQA